MTALEDLRRGWRLPADAFPVAFSRHAVERFGERCRPGLDDAEIRQQLSGLLRGVRVVAERPEWLGAPNSEEKYVTAWLIVADMAMPLRRHENGELWASTTLSPREIASAARKRRNRQRNHRTSAKGRAAKVRMDGRGRRPDGPDVAEWGDDA